MKLGFKITKKMVAIIVILIVFPFALEKFLYITPVVSRFTNETWFSFMASYSGAIATFIVLKITLEENLKAVENEKERLRKSYEIDREIEKVKNIQKVLLLDKYDFVNLNTLAIDYSRFVKELYDIQYEIREFQFEKNGETARDKYFTRLFLLERSYSLEFYVEQLPNMNDEKELKKYASLLIEKTSKMCHNANSHRNEVLNLYSEYIREMKLKEYE